MQHDVDKLAELLREGQRRSKQGSYQRRMPAEDALPNILEARRRLRRMASDVSANAQVWRLLSQAEEMLLAYRGARLALEHALQLEGSKDKKDLKRLAVLREGERTWRELSLSPEQLRDLGSHLEATLAGSPCDHTSRVTRAWLESQGLATDGKVLNALRDRGGYCDCEVLTNVVVG
jgi:hypothetical protein